MIERTPPRLPVEEDVERATGGRAARRGTSTFSYVVPAPDGAATLPATMAALATGLRAFPGSEVIVVGDGSGAGTFEAAAALAAAHSTEAVPVVARRSPGGLGPALRLGIQRATGDWICCTAAGLPLGLADLQAFLDLDEPPPVVLVTHGQAGPTARRSWRRRLLTVGWRLAGRAVVGAVLPDPRATLFIERPLAVRLAPLAAGPGWLLPTELAALARRRGQAVAEVPVVLDPPGDGPTDRPAGEGLRLLAALVGLRRRLRADAARQARAGTLAAGCPRWLARTSRRVGGLAAGALGLAVGLAALLLPAAVVAAIALGADRLRSAPGPLHGRPVVAAWTVALLVAGAAAAMAAARRRRRGRGRRPASRT